MTDAPAYGEPSAGLVCTSTRGREVTFRGLFGDAWLVCSLRTAGVSAGESTNQAVDRAGRWCVAAARAAALTRPKVKASGLSPAGLAALLVSQNATPRRLTAAAVLLATAFAGTPALLSSADAAPDTGDRSVARAADRYGVSESALRAGCERPQPPR